MVPTQRHPSPQGIKCPTLHYYIRNKFHQEVIGYGGCVEWPPRSPDLNPLDFFLYGCIKQRVYATPPPTLQELRNRITDACASMSPAMLYNVQREVQSRVQMCMVAEGHHFEHEIVSFPASAVFLNAIKKMCVLCFSFVALLCARYFL
ncbi:hypothetical protein AVEN_182748-1 [Araneus ventricosus]|uniref:Uncharacterized protein n=1 Tax=Araneus ventricosus TaxID=182803 RepID=A0A4Y2N1Q8_ARAVE|nr:hypothetical protein AVEN_182748-1 [Araneus ventricosus]